MTKRALRWHVFVAILAACGMIVAGIVLKATYPNSWYDLFKDMLPLPIAIAAAWLTYCFSQRSTYLQGLDTLWSQLLNSVQSAIQYTHLPAPKRKDYRNVLRELSAAVDETRRIFKNIGEGEDWRGLYPFEEIKRIFQIVSSLGYGDKFNPKEAPQARAHIIEQWKQLQEPFLSEFDRKEP